MADEVDQTADRIENELSFKVGELCRKAAAIPAGHPGECHYCGEHFARVVTVAYEPFDHLPIDACGRCRDRRGLK